MGNIRRNAELFKRISGTRLCAVVKADAYGHGAEEVTLALADVAECFAVALVEEGLCIRQAACGKDILVFSPPITEEECYAIAVNGFIAILPDLHTAKLLSHVCEKFALTARVHLKVNTGMNRYGADLSKWNELCAFLRKNPFIQVEGVYSHLYTTNEQISSAQRELFTQAVRICKRYFSSFIAHLGATYGAMLGEKYAFDMVRVGLGLYGYSPIKTELSLHKGMSVKAQVACDRRYAFGGVGYGEKTAEKGEKLFLLRGGYADGFLRAKDNGLDGAEQNANLLCMDSCLRKGDRRKGEWIYLLTDADKTAAAVNTVAYEVLCAATRRAERIYDYE